MKKRKKKNQLTNTSVQHNYLVLYFQVSNKFAFSLFDLDWDVFSAHIDGACNRVPVIAETGVKSTVCGPESFTADHKPLMGEAPELCSLFSSLALPKRFLEISR